MPGRAKIVSVISAPETSAPASSANTVSTGTAALGKAWRQTTARSGRPFMRAVRM